MSYEESVERAATVLVRGEDDNWELARLTYENTQANGGPPDRPGVSLEQWAADVRAKSNRKFSTRTAGLYRRIWQEYGEKHSTTVVECPSWSEASDMVNGRADHPTAREGWSEWEVKNVARLTTPEQKAKIVTALAADPDVQAAASQHGAVRAAVASLVQQASQADTLHREREYSKDTVSQHLDSQRALLDLERALRTFVAAVDQLWPFLKGLPQADTDPTATHIFLDENLEEAELRVQRIRRFLETGETSLDRVLGDILREGV